MRRTTRLWAAALSTLLLLWLLPAVAGAHAVVTRTFPSQGQRLDKAPPWVEVQFNEPVSAAFTPLAVRDSRGQKVDAGDAAIDPSDPTHLSVSLTPLPDGLYTATYRVTSLDGHPIEGSVAFIVGDAAELAPPEAQAEESKVPWAVSVLHGLVQSVTTLLAGLTAFLAIVWLPVAPSRRLGGWAVGLVVLLAGLGLAELSLFAVRASGEPVSLSLLLTALSATRVGQIWLLRLGLGVLAGVALARLDQAKAAWQRLLLLLPGAALLFTLSLQSHAYAAGSWLALVADWLHLVGLAPWAGGLAGFALAGWPVLASQPGPERGALLGLLVSRFSKLATGAVLLLALTGLYSAGLHLPEPSALWTTQYGRALLWKLLLLLPLLALGGFNLLRRGAGPFRQAVVAELGLMSAIFLAAGFLTTLPPATVEVVLNRGPFSETAQVDGFTIGLTVTPNRLGYNQASIQLTRPDGSPETGASTGLRLTMLEHEMGSESLEAKEISPGLYRTDLMLGMQGVWRIEVVTLTKGGREVRHPFQVEIPAPPSR